MQADAATAEGALFQEGWAAATVAMEAVYHLTGGKNTEIRLRWHTLCLRAGSAFIVGEVVDFLTSNGRMKVRQGC